MPSEFEEKSTGHIVQSSNGSKISKKSDRNPKGKRAKAEDQLVNYARRIDQEVQGFNVDASELVKGYMHHQADRAIDALEGAEEHFFERFEERLGGLQVDPDSFRERSGSLKQRLLERLGVVGEVSNMG